MKFTPPKGTQDIYGGNWYLRQWIATQILNVLERYGFRQVQTPVIESRAFMSILAGKDMTDQMYMLKDKSGRDLVIRPDITPALTRLFIQTGKSQPKPIKFSCYDRVYRYERPQEGRYREIYQINAELFGAPPPLADAELLACFYDCYKAVRLENTRITIGFRPLMKRWIKLWGAKSTDVNAVIRAIDKRAKVSPKKFEMLLADAGFPKANRVELDQLLLCKGSIAKTRNAINKLALIDKKIAIYVQQFFAILDLFSTYSIDSVCTIDLGLARGFEYYTGIIFEAINPEFSSSIGGGGRYDTLVAAFSGLTTPATGFSIGIDRVTQLISQQNKNLTKSPQIDYVIAADIPNPELQKRAILLTQTLRSSNCRVEFDLVGKTTSEQIARGRKIGASYVILMKSNTTTVTVFSPKNDIVETLTDTQLITKAQKSHHRPTR